MLKVSEPAPGMGRSGLTRLAPALGWMTDEDESILKRAAPAGPYWSPGMGFRWAAKNTSPIGIDFGSDSVKLLQMTTDEPQRLLGAAQVDLPSDVRRDAGAYASYLGPALREAVRDARFKGRRAVASISAAHTYIQHLRIARCDDALLEQQIQAELRGKLPIDPAAMIIRHVTVGEVFADNANKQEVITMAVPRQWVMQIVQIAKAAGLDIVGMHVEPLAIIQAFAHLFRRATDAERTTLFLDIGASTTKALIAHGKQLVFAKNIHVGGNNFSHDAQEPAASTEPPTPAPAETPSPGELQLPADSDRRRVVSEQPLGPAIATAVDNAPDPAVSEPDDARQALIDELQLCLGYHKAMHADRSIDKIVFLGGTCRAVELPQAVARALRLPAQLGDPLARLTRTPDAAAPVNVDLRQGQPGWAVPAGLCLLPTNL